MVKSKQNIRTEMLERRMSMTEKECFDHSLKICHRIMADRIYQDASVIYTYMAFRNEVNLMPLIQHAVLAGKKIAIPRIQETVMNFFLLEMNSQMLPKTEEGYFHIQEPDKAALLAPAPDLILFPGIAFTEYGQRIGYGKGFYDRYMQEQNFNQKIITAGVCYQCQMTDSIPSEEHDYPLDYIITEENIYESSRRHSETFGN